MKKVIIVGAGPAGLTAAYELLKKSDEMDVTVLEESQDMGGISKTVRYKGNRMDMAATVSSPKCRRSTSGGHRCCLSREHRPGTTFI